MYGYYLCCSIANKNNNPFLHHSSLLDIDECTNHTCSNGGSCVDGVNNYSCKCMPGFKGDRCQTGAFLKNYQEPVYNVLLLCLIFPFLSALNLG